MDGAKRFKVVVSAVVERERKVGKEWTVVGEEVVPRDQYEKWGKTPDTAPLRNVMGYTPEIVKTVREEMQVFEQTVDKLDMAKLVAVINGLSTNVKLNEQA
jgi:hypothetical protein